jgi:hypothetical protein
LAHHWSASRSEIGSREEVRQALSALEQIRGTAERRAATELLVVAKLLRDGDTDRAFEVLETTIERHRAAIDADQGTPRASLLDANILKSIQEYQASYPWSPPTPSAEESAFASRFGRLTPMIQSGQVIGFQVWNVQPGNLLAESGVLSGDLITHYDGGAVSLDRRPTLFEALQSGSQVDLVVRAPDGTVRELRVPQR